MQRDFPPFRADHVGSILRSAPIKEARAAHADGKRTAEEVKRVEDREIEKIVRGWADAVWLQGKRFGTIGLKHQGREIEITTHRAEAYVPDSRKPDVEFSDDVVTDLSRRDFTVNAMALAVPDVELIDPFGGLDDLAARRLRTPIVADESFHDDPLRNLALCAK